MLHGGGECDRVAARVSLHALWLAGRAGGIEDVAGVAGLDERARDLGVHVGGAQRGVVEVAAFYGGELAVETAVHDHDFLRRRGG